MDNFTNILRDLFVFNYLPCTILKSFGNSIKRGHVLITPVYTNFVLSKKHAKEQFFHKHEHTLLTNTHNT